MKTYPILTLFLLLVLTNCSNRSSTTTYSELKIADRFTEQYSETVNNKTKVTYEHNLILQDFNPDLYAENDLISLADKYLDTVAANKPIFSITICKPFKLERYYDSRDVGHVRDHAIISFEYDTDSTGGKLPNLKELTLWQDGKPIQIAPINLDERRRKLLTK